MLCLPLQNRVTIRSVSGAGTSVTQPESGWLDLSAFQDIIAYTQTSEITVGGGTSVTITFQTSPTKDESLWADVTGAVTLATGLLVTKMLKETTSRPLSRFLRWKLATSTTPRSVWDATFMVWIAANMVGRGGRVSTDTMQRMPAFTPSMPLSPRMRNGNGGAPYMPPASTFFPNNGGGGGTAGGGTPGRSASGGP